LNPIISPGTNPSIAAIDSPDAARLDECTPNCVAVVLILLWDSNRNIFPVVAVKFGKGFLIQTGMSLDEESTKLC
jgi:hypothetical protein